MSIQTIKQYKKVTEVLWNWYQDSKDTLANSSNWDTAFGWGDHSAAGYLTDAPSDGSQYARIDGGWAEVAAGGTPAITDNQVVVGTGVGIEGDANLTWAGNVLLVKTNEFENQTTPTTGIIVENTDADFGGIKKTIISGVVISMEGTNAESNITDTFLEFISTSQGRLVMRNNSIEHFNATNNAFSTAFNWETPTTVTKTLTIPHEEGTLATREWAAANGYDTTGYTVATLPASPTTGDRTFVTDSTVAASGNFGATVAGAGANTVPVFYDGTNWIIA